MKMKRILSLLLMLTVCLVASSSNTISAANSKQDQEKEKKEKVKRLIISGIVTDEQGNYLDGVSILPVRESDSEPPVGTVTHNRGQYNIFINSNRTLVFSLAGYESQKKDIKDRDEIDVTMKKIQKEK